MKFNRLAPRDLPGKEVCKAWWLRQRPLDQCRAHNLSNEVSMDGRPHSSYTWRTRFLVRWAAYWMRSSYCMTVITTNNRFQLEIVWAVQFARDYWNTTNKLTNMTFLWVDNPYHSGLTRQLGFLIWGNQTDIIILGKNSILMWLATLQVTCNFMFHWPPMSAQPPLAWGFNNNKIELKTIHKVTF